MQTKGTTEAPNPSVRAVIPPPAVVRDGVPAPVRLRASPPTSGTTQPASSTRRRNPVSVQLAKLLGVLRGDKYMVNAYPPGWHNAGAARDGDDVASVRSVVAPEPGTGEPAAPPRARPRER
jgi:hypothetical protein